MDRFSQLSQSSCLYAVTWYPLLACRYSARFLILSFGQNFNYLLISLLRFGIEDAALLKNGPDLSFILPIGCEHDKHPRSPRLHLSWPCIRQIRYSPTLHYTKKCNLMITRSATLNNSPNFLSPRSFRNKYLPLRISSLYESYRYF